MLEKHPGQQKKDMPMICLVPLCTYIGALVKAAAKAGREMWKVDLDAWSLGGGGGDVKFGSVLVGSTRYIQMMVTSPANADFLFQEIICIPPHMMTWQTISFSSWYRFVIVRLSSSNHYPQITLMWRAILICQSNDWVRANICNVAQVFLVLTKWTTVSPSPQKMTSSIPWYYTFKPKSHLPQWKV